ncbi:MAG: diguanylate cyclase [Lachnospiraceae bacterium]|nr:diguanylate cyclase [Lachnospiraceae bacterium]
MEKKKRTAWNIIRVIVCGAVLMFCVYSLFVKVGRENQHITTYDVDSGWKVTIKDTLYSNVTLSRFDKPQHYERGDIVTMERRLPAQFPLHAGIRIRVHQAEVRVYVDGLEIYDYGRERFQCGKYLGSGYHFVQLPDGCGGQKLRIVLISSEKRSSRALPDVVATSVSDMYRSFVADNIFSIYFNLFILLLGVVLLIISLAFVSMNGSYLVLTATGLFSIVISVWSLCYEKIFELFGMSPAAISQLEYIFLYILPFPFLFLMLEVRKDIPIDRKRLLHISTLACACFLFIALYFHFTDYMHLPKMINTYHGIAVIVYITAMVIIHKPFRKQTLAEKIFTVSLYCLLVTGIAEVIRFSLQNRFSSVEGLQVTYFPLGVLIFVAGTIFSYLVNLFRRVVDAQEIATLEEMTYVDSMTGIYNRMKANERFAAVDQDKEAVYAIAFFDLNGLKKTNDTYGHEEGDRLIKAMASVLKQAFFGVGDVFRMGGDEFVVLLTGDKTGAMETGIKTVVSMEEEVSKDTKIPVDASYGVADSTEAGDGGIEAVARLADSRMYEMKKRSGKGRDF